MREREKAAPGKVHYNILKAASWYTVGNILIKGASFFVLPVFTSLMNTHEYGIYSIYISYMAVFEVILLLGLSSTVNIAKYTEGICFRNYMGTAAVMPVMFGAVCLLALNIYFCFADAVFSMGRMLWNCMVITAAAGAAAQIIGAGLIIEGEYKKYMAYSLLSTAGNIIFSLLLCFTIYRTEDVYMARVAGNLISAVISTAFLMRAAKTRLQIDTLCAKMAVRWGIPLLFHTLSTVILTQSDRIMIRSMDSYSSAGIYSIAVTFTAIPAVLETSLSQAWAPWFYQKLNEKKYEAVRKLNDVYILVFACIIAGFMIVSPDLTCIFTRESYWESILSTLPLAVSVFGEFLYSIPASVEYYYKKTTYLMSATMITAAANIILNFLFIRRMGYAGAAFATMLSKLLLFLMHCGFACRADRNRMFHGKTVAGSLIFLIMLCMLLFYYYQVFLLRVFCALAAGLAGVLWAVKHWEDIKILIHR